MNLAQVSLILQQISYTKFFNMHLYIDKENVESLVKGRKANLGLYTDIANYIKKGMMVQYNFSKEELLKNQYLQVWFRTISGDGVKSKPEFCPPKNVFPSTPVKLNFLSNQDSDAYRSIYLLCMDNNISKLIQDKQCVLIGNVGEEYDVIKKLSSLDDKEILTNSIGSWNEYCPELPLTDIILCDEHYFKDRYVYEKNQNEILTSLCQTTKSQINVVIITKEGEIDTAIDIKEECKNIKDQISLISGISKGKCKVTVLTTRKTHSRHLITNYFRIVHTSCFHLIGNGLKDDVNTDIASCTSVSANSVTDGLITLFQSIADSPVKSFGDKFSNFLTFP